MGRTHASELATPLAYSGGMREPEYPHRFVKVAFGVCGVCGMDLDDRAPATCDHDPAHPCTTCPPAHIGGARSAQTQSKPTE